MNKLREYWIEWPDGETPEIIPLIELHPTNTRGAKLFREVTLGEIWITRDELENILQDVAADFDPYQSIRKIIEKKLNELFGAGGE